MLPLGNQSVLAAANGENRYQPTVWGETGLRESMIKPRERKTANRVAKGNSKKGVPSCQKQEKLLLF